MRRFLYVLGALFLGLLVISGVGIGMAVHDGRALDAESKAYVDTAIPAIAKNWSEAEFLNRATPELRGSMSPDQLASLFGEFDRLGSLVAYRGSVGDSMMSYIAGKGKTVSASYLARAAFQNGNAIIRIALLKRNGQWRINGFHVNLDPNTSGVPRPTAA
jgi:hypothetical protein